MYKIDKKLLKPVLITIHSAPYGELWWFNYLLFKKIRKGDIENV